MSECLSVQTWGELLLNITEAWRFYLHLRHQCRFGVLLVPSGTHIKGRHPKVCSVQLHQFAILLVYVAAALLHLLLMTSARASSTKAFATRAS